MPEEEKNYKEKQREKMDSYVVGEKDTLGYTIAEVHIKAKDYIVYEIETNILSKSLKVMLCPEVEGNPEFRNRYNEIIDKLTIIKGLLHKVIDAALIKSQIASILSMALNGDPEKANKNFDALIKKINDEYRRRFKKKLCYLITTCSITALLILFSIFTYYCNSFPNKITILIFIVTSGAIGGFVSVSGGLRKNIFEEEIKTYLYVIYGFERIFISIVSAVIVYFAIKSNLIFGITEELENSTLVYIVFGVVAGFSETFVPSLLEKLERKNE